MFKMLIIFKMFDVLKMFGDKNFLGNTYINMKIQAFFPQWEFLEYFSAYF